MSGDGTRRRQLGSSPYREIQPCYATASVRDWAPPRSTVGASPVPDFDRFLPLRLGSLQVLSEHGRIGSYSVLYVP